MSDRSAVEAVLTGSADGEKAPLNNGDEPQLTADQICEQIDFIGGKITEVSIFNLPVQGRRAGRVGSSGALSVVLLQLGSRTWTSRAPASYLFCYKVSNL